MSNKIVRRDGLLPFRLTSDIDKHFEATPEGALEHDDFINIAEAIQATGSDRNQRAAAALFMTLPKEEVLRRAGIVIRLEKLLKTIKSRRYDLSSTPTT